MRMPLSWSMLLASLCFSGTLHAQRLPFVTGDDNFSPQALVQGVSATAAACAQVANAVWARTPAGEAECIRYWASGLAAGQPAPRALVYIPGDQMAFDVPDPTYGSRNPQSVQQLADAMHARLEVPVIVLGRPGTFGSSGEHKQRRREPEARLVSAALDAIGAKHAIAEWGMVGLSGGGHTVAALLGWRSDIVCAVPASAVSSPRLRWQVLGRESDFTGHADSYEPLPQLRREVFHPKLRVFVLGDPRDSNVPWSTQLPLAARLKELGASVETLTGEGGGGQRHFLGASGQLVGSLCLRDRPTQDILDLAARGLKG